MYHIRRANPFGNVKNGASFLLLEKTRMKQRIIEIFNVYVYGLYTLTLKHNSMLQKMVALKKLCPYFLNHIFRSIK